MSVRARVARIERLRGAAARPIEFWDGTDEATGRFTCPDHPGRELTEDELEAHVQANEVDVVLFVNTDPKPGTGPW